MIQCPRCHGDRLSRSRTRRWWERLIKPLGWRAYRCREQTCGWRGLVKIKPTREALQELLGAYKHVLWGLGASAVAVIVILQFIIR